MRQGRAASSGPPGLERTYPQVVISKLCGRKGLLAVVLVCEMSWIRRVVPSAAVPEKWRVLWNTKLLLLKLPPNHSVIWPV